jgi:hypothetical protein
MNQQRNADFQIFCIAQTCRARDGSERLPIWKSATQQTWKSALLGCSSSVLRISWLRFLTRAAFLWVVVSTSGAEVDLSKLPPPATNKVDFATDIKPILEGHCLKCHSGEKPKSHFRLTNRESALHGGEHGVDILPGQSARSPLIHYVSGLVEDMQMPPEGRGTPLTPEEIGLLRAWIDQDVSWTGTTNEPTTTASATPTVGRTEVHGDEKKFRELYWQREGWNSGLEEFEITQKPTPDSKISTTGHVLHDDYKVMLAAEKDGLGFTHLGWSQFRKYYDDSGGYVPLLTPPIYELNQDLHVDTGRAWADFGLALPHWPTLVLGYEYQYRNGTEATLQWGPVGPDAEPRSIYPGFKEISEHINILKLDVDYELVGIAMHDSFRGEWYRLSNQQLNENLSTNGSPVLSFTSANEQQHYFQGANSFHIEKQLTGWFFAGGGYLYSKLNAHGGQDMQTFNAEVLSLSQYATPAYAWNNADIELERESHVFSLSALLGPWAGLSLYAGTQNEWTRQTGFGTAALYLYAPYFTPPTYTNFSGLLRNQTALSDIDHRIFSQDVGVRFTKIPFTTLFAEARFRQDDYGLFEEENGANQFLRNTDATSHLTDFRAGFNTSPWRRLSLSAQFRRSDNETDYKTQKSTLSSGIPTGTPFEGYPGFILSRDLLSNEADTKLSLQVVSWLKASLGYQWQGNDYHTETESVTNNMVPLPVPGGISPGGSLLAGTYNSHTATANLTLTPWRKLFLSTTFAYQNARTVTTANDSPSVVPYAGNIYSVILSGNYALSDKTSLIAAYAFSHGDFSQENFAEGLPLGIDYRQDTLVAGLQRKLNRNCSLGFQYRYYRYDEPSSGGFSNFDAHAVFATLACRLP